MTVATRDSRANAYMTHSPTVMAAVADCCCWQRKRSILPKIECVVYAYSGLSRSSPFNDASE